MEVLLVILGGITFLICAVALLGWRLEQGRKLVEIPREQTPDVVLQEAEQRVAGLLIDRVQRRGNTYRLHGRAEGGDIQVKVKLHDQKSQPRVSKIEIQLELRASHRSLKGKHRIELSGVPPRIIKAANEAASAYGAAMEEISRVKAATVQGRNAYDIKGWSGDWRVEVELLDDGELLEVELELRPGRTNCLSSN